MTSRSLTKIAAASWLALLLSVASLFIFALLTPEVALFTTVSDRDAEIQSIKAETDISRLQQTAVNHVSASYGTGTTATLLCRIALVTLLVVIIGSISSLVQIRRLRKEYDKIAA